MSDQVPLEKMTTVELTMWLQSKGFGAAIQTAFEEEEMDGEAVMAAFATCSGPDCIKDIIKTYGSRLKVYTALKAAIGESYQQSESTHQSSQSSPFPSTPSSSVFNQRDISGDGDDTTIYPSSGSSLSPQIVSKKVLPKKLMTKGPPDPFPVPMFKEDVEESLGEKKLSHDDRKYMCRVLGTVLQTHVQKPSMKHCEIVAKALVRKFPFLKEYHSWTNFIYTRCQNINRKCKSARRDKEEDEGMKITKKAKIDPEKHSYPSLLFEDSDEVAFERNVSLMKQEMAKSKPQFGSVTSLMQRTFLRRRQWILDDTQKVEDICLMYPCLSKSIYVAYDFGLVMQNDNLEGAFESSWSKYSIAIIAYANASRTKSKDLKHALREEDCSSPTALRCLGHFLTTKTKKKAAETSIDADVPFVIKEVPCGTPPGEAVDSSNNHPHIVKFVDASDDLPQYFIAVEQELLLQCKSLERAIFIMVAAHYVFNIEYHPKVKDVFYFLQEKVFGFPDASFKKSSVYLSVSSAIDLYL